MSAQISSILSSLKKGKGSSPNDTQTQLDDLLPLILKHNLTLAQFNTLTSIALSSHPTTPQCVLLLSHALPTPSTTISAAFPLQLLSILGSASHNKPPHKGKIDYKVQNRALHLLVALGEWGMLDGGGKDGAREVLEEGWGVLERGLEYRNLRDATAQLLIQITKRYHVQPYRITHLKQIIAATSPTTPPSLHALLSLYTSFYPDRILSSTSNLTSIAGKTRKPAWVKEWEENMSGANGEGENNTERPSKRRRVDEGGMIGGIMVPDGSTFNASMSSTPLSDIQSLSTLAKSIDKVELPSMAGSLLRNLGSEEERDRVKVWGVLLRSGYSGGDGDGEANYLGRLESYLTSLLSHQVSLDEMKASTSAGLEFLFQRIISLGDVFGHLPPTLLSFLSNFLSSWNGSHHRSEIFSILSSLPPISFERMSRFSLPPVSHLSEESSTELEESILGPLRKLSEEQKLDAVWMADLVDSLEGLMMNWANAGGDEEDEEAEEEQNRTVWGNDVLAPEDLRESLQGLLHFVDRLASTGVQTYPTSLTLRSSCLSFFEASLRLPLEFGIAVVVIPSSIFVYTCLLSEEISSVTRICGIVSTLREVLTGEATAIDKEAEGNRELVAELNTYLVDFINALWRKSLGEETNGGKGMGLDLGQIEGLKKLCEERGQAWGNGIGLTVHPALAMMARDCLSKMEEKAGSTPVNAGSGPVLASSLKNLSANGGPKVTFTNFRVAFLEYLEERGATGIHQFFFTSLQSLIDRRASQPRSSP
ncbi:centromere protein I, partial [Phenoliferia sp. Uapishka_3]